MRVATSMRFLPTQMVPPRGPRWAPLAPRRSAIVAVALLIALGPAPQARAGTLRAWTTWIDGQPHVEVSVIATPIDGLTEIAVPVQLFDAQDKLLWQAAIKVPALAAAPWKVRVPIEKIAEPDKTHRLHVVYRNDDLGIDASETIRFSNGIGPILSHGVRTQGAFPARTVLFTIVLNPSRGRERRPIPVSLSIRDAQENVVATKQTAIRPGETPRPFAIDVTPPADAGLGPFTLEASVESEPDGVALSAIERFAQPNAAVPVTSFEHGDPTQWFAADGRPQNYRTLQMYYSEHLRDLVPRDDPRIGYDRDQKRSGRQSLRIDYAAGREANAWGRQELPGRPVVMSLWVQGNGTQDQLWAHFEDRSNFTLPAWQRNANFSEAPVCTLSHIGWKRFRIPVLGDGLQVTTFKGSTVEVDAPVRVLCFSLRPGPLAEGQKAGDPRTVRIDDLFVETQAPPAERLSLEVENSRTDGLLTADAVLTATIGSGLSVPIRAGRVTIAARDARGEPVHSANLPLTLSPGEFATLEISLKDLERKKPVGPIEVDVAALDPDQPAARVARRMTLKRPVHRGMFLDFEAPNRYSSFQPGKVGPHIASIVAAGNGHGNALSLPVDPRKTDNSVLLHPALPGEIEHIEFDVRAPAGSVLLQPWFIDSGFTGVWLRPYNLFWADPIRVDSPEWRTVKVPAPPIPPHHGDRNRYFLFQPWYPLNLAFNANAEGETPAEIQIDNLRVTTHLPPDDELRLELRYLSETRLHPPGAPLELVAVNFAPDAVTRPLAYTLNNYQGFVAGQGTVELSVGPGEKKVVPLVPSLPAGMYDLVVSHADRELVRATIPCVNAQEWFGPDPVATLSDPVALRKSLGLAAETIYLDWDNFEAAPYLTHFHWFNEELKKRSPEFRLVPIVGFCTDWAGPEAAESLEKGTYRRYMGNMLQTPRNLLNWSLFVRQTQREYKDRFDTWIFWENPDLDDAPQSIPPEKYRPMLAAFHKWVKQYNPNSRVVAGGFNFGKALDYLERIPEPHTLPFDEIAVQVNPGELSPERADLESFLDELNATLRLREQNRTLRITELDWGVGPLVSPRDQAAHHARAAMILHSRGAEPHQLSLINTGFDFSGFGVTHRIPYGNTPELQSHQAVHVPKPAYFALIAMRRFLNAWTYRATVALPGRSLQDNRAFVYTNDAGRLAAIVWRSAEGNVAFRLPDAWRGVEARDAFGFPVDLARGLPCTGLPTILLFPEGTAPAELLSALRRLPTTDGRFPVWLDLHVPEAAAANSPPYVVAGSRSQAVRSGVIPGGERFRAFVVSGIESEHIAFTAERAGHALLRRRWWFEGDGQTLEIRLNDRPPQTWDLSGGQTNESGPRESTFVLRDCQPGENRISIRYSAPGNAASYRIEPLEGSEIPLERWGILHTRQSKGHALLHASAVGTPPRIGRRPYDDALGTHATSFVEYPLDGQFDAFKTEVGIDGGTEGRGSVVFRVFVDGKLRADSGLVNGFTPPKTLSVDGLAGARRLILNVTDAGDGDRHDLANWVNGKLSLPR